MLDLAEARKRVLAAIEHLSPVTSDLERATGLVLAEDVIAPHDLPRFDNSSMDGYAVSSGDVAAPGTTLPLSGEVRAGMTQAELAPGSTVRIMTGAPVPPGADAIVPLEVARERNGEVTFETPAKPGAFIRRAGEDLHEGAVAVPAGTELDAGALALVAATGRAEVAVFPRPRVAVLVTGDEIVGASESMEPGQIRDTNSVALTALVGEAGGLVERVRRVPDDYDTAIAEFRGAADADLIVSSGGVSVGRYDLVKRVVDELGETHFWRVAMKPGKPVVLGRIGSTPFLGLPGNPVSVHVGFEQFVRPAIRKLRGCRTFSRPTITAHLTTDVPHQPGRLELVRVRLARDGKDWTATPTSRAQASHIQSSLIDTHGVARVPLDADVLPAGTEIEVEVWRLPEEA